MKPIRLTMQAFSTYLDKTVIDFSGLNDKGVYLITGDTGAGKTTIFDAICYGLYVQTSGSNRSADIFRSDYAPTNVPTIIELEFSLQGKTYTVHRERSYTKAGNKSADKDWLKGESLNISGRRAVSDKVKELLGVDGDQFRQIIMLAQGEFSQLLTASTKDKQAIYRDIFRTGNLDALARRLTREKKALEQKTDNVRASLDALERTLPYDDLAVPVNDVVMQMAKDHLDEDRKALSEDEVLYNERREKAKALQDAYILANNDNKNIDNAARLKARKATLDEAKDSYDHMDKAIAGAQKARHVLELEKDVTRLGQEMTQSAERLTHLRSEAAALAKRKEAHKEKEASLPVLEEDARRLEKIIEQSDARQARYEKYEAQKVRADKKNKAIVKMQKEIEDLQAVTDKRARTLAKDEASVAELPDIQRQLDENDKVYKDTNNRRDLFHRLSDNYTEYIKRQDTYYNLVQDFNKAYGHYQNANSTYLGMMEAYRANIIGSLAKELQDNSPCPVCGSIHHPRPAHGGAEAITLGELKAQEDKMNDLQEDFNIARETMETAKERADKIDLEMKQMMARLDFNEELSVPNITRALADVEILKADVMKEHKRLEGEYQYRTKLAKSVTLSRHDQEKDQKVLEAKREELEAARRDLAAAQSVIATLLEEDKELDTFDPKLMADDRKRLTQKQKSIKAIQDESARIEKDIVTSDTRIKESEAEQKRLLESQTQAKQAFEEARTTTFGHKDAYEQAKADLAKLSDMQSEVAAYRQKCKSVDEELRRLLPLIEGKVRADLEAMAKARDDFESERKALDEAYVAKKTMVNKTASTIKEMDKLLADNTRLMDQLALYTRMADVTSGHANNLSFEQYVLSYYFERILAFANQELRQLSDGRYEFRRSTDYGGRGFQGLDINVVDYDTGLERDVKTLSGGESFKAALALALGMSTMIQSFAGGIELNALFIDEGFGSLDDESLHTAVNVLYALRDTDKVIGIISHVSELRSLIDANITVKAGDQGSTIKVNA